MKINLSTIVISTINCIKLAFVCTDNRRLQLSITKIQFKNRIKLIYLCIGHIQQRAS